MKEKVRSHKGLAKFKVIGQHEEWVRRLARSLVFDSNRAEDIVQQTWLEMFKRPPAEAGNLRGWLTVVVKNVARKMNRSDRNREKRERRSAKGEEIVEIASAKQDKDSLQKNILRAVESLDEPYRTTVRMRYFEELSPGEIARRTQSPLDTVYTRLRRGLAQLRAKLDKQYGDRSLWTTIAVSWIRPAKLKSVGALVAASVAVLAIPATLLLLGVPGTAAEKDHIAKTESSTTVMENDIPREHIPELPTPVPTETFLQTPLETPPELQAPSEDDPVAQSSSGGEGSETIDEPPAKQQTNQRVPTMMPTSKKPGESSGQPARPIKNGPKKSSKTFQPNVFGQGTGKIKN